MAAENRITVAVLMGGPSPEYDVSLASGRNIVLNLPADRYDVLPVEVDREGRWQAFDEQAYRTFASAFFNGETTDTPAPVAEGLEAILRRPAGVDIALIAMHGPYGEDGTVQALLEAHNVPYTGSNLLASALCMSKCRSKLLFEIEEVLTPEWREVRQHGYGPEIVSGCIEEFGLPLMVKTDCSGSSIGVYFCESEDEVARAIEECLQAHPVCLVEEYLDGVELTVPVVGDSLRGDVTPLAVTEIVPAGKFFDFESKYNDPETQEITPARVPETVFRMAQAMAVRAHQALGCAGITRSDLIWVNDRELEGGLPYVAVFEVNTIPGMTPASIIPRAVEMTGGKFADLLERLIEETLHPLQAQTADTAGA